MQIDCGPAHDVRTLKFELPPTKSRIAVCISGGIDSAILYYMLMLANQDMGNLHEIVPASVSRKDGSKHFAKLVVGHMAASFNRPYVAPLIVGNPELPEGQQVKSAVQQLYTLGFQQAYVGIIEQLDEHTLGYEKPTAPENNFYRTPIRNLQKPHVLDLVIKNNQQALFYITHACEKYEITRCNTCNGCRERHWGFEQLALSDPSML